MNQNDNLLGVVEVLLKRKKAILYVCGTVFLGSIIISLLLPVYYRSSTIFYAASPDLANPDKMFGGGNSDTYYYGSGEDIDRLLTIASSNELVEFLVREFDLYEHYDIDPSGAKAPYKVQEQFMDLYEVQKTKFDAIELSVEDQNKVMAAAIANAARMKLESIATRLLKQSQERQLKTYEGNIAASELTLRQLGDSLAVLRQQYGIYNSDVQGEILATLLAGSRSKLVGLRGKYESLKANPRTPRDTLMYVLANQKAAEDQVEKLTEDVEKFNQGVSVVDILSDQHEKARYQLSWDKERYKHLQAAYVSEVPVIHLVEQAPVPIVKHRPKRAVLVIASTLAAVLFCVIGILVFENYRDVDWRSLANGSPEAGSGRTRREERVA